MRPNLSVLTKTTGFPSLFSFWVFNTRNAPYVTYLLSLPFTRIWAPWRQEFLSVVGIALFPAFYSAWHILSVNICETELKRMASSCMSTFRQKAQTFGMGGLLLAVDVRRGHDKSVVDSCLYTASGVCSAGSAHMHKAVFITHHCSLV